jgi:hypothetical protein
MAGETSSRPTIAGFEISTRATPGFSASIEIKKERRKGRKSSSSN